MSIEIVYYVACSVDGFIAETDGGVDWLSSVEGPGEDYGYGDFFAGVDAMVIGSRTYEQVLGFGDWPYGEKPCWVMTRRPLEVARPQVRLTDGTPEGIALALEERGLRRADGAQRPCSTLPPA